MSGKDFLKTLLCLFEYDMNIEIDVTRPDADGTCQYEIHATNSKTGDDFYSEPCDGIIHAAWSILEYMHQMTIDKDDPNKYMYLVEDAEESEPWTRDDGHSFIQKEGEPSLKWARTYLKDLLNDEWRENKMQEWIKEKKEKDEYNAFFKDTFAKIDSLMPCRNGTCKDREYSDWALDHCMKSYYNNCQKVHEWRAIYDELMKKRNAEWKKYLEEKNGKKE
jgi:hypothetical protein